MTAPAQINSWRPLLVNGSSTCMLSIEKAHPLYTALVAYIYPRSKGKDQLTEDFTGTCRIHKGSRFSQRKSTTDPGLT